jgi:hypothetical protein
VPGGKRFHYVAPAGSLRAVVLSAALTASLFLRSSPQFPERSSFIRWRSGAISGLFASKQRCSPVAEWAARFSRYVTRALQQMPLIVAMV